MIIFCRLAVMIVFSVMLAACTTPVPEPEPEVPVLVEVTPAPLPVVVPTGPSDEVRRQMIMADMLFAASVALENNRLMPPAENSAWEQYRAILDFDPDNEQALQGLGNIKQRYIDLADGAIAIGKFDDADTYLRRAARLEGREEALAITREKLADARETDTEFYTLNPQELSQQSPAIMDRLSEIGQGIHEREARFLITARSDAEGRWIYSTMREALGGQRLRGNISIGSEPGIQVNLPSQD